MLISVRLWNFIDGVSEKARFLTNTLKEKHLKKMKDGLSKSAKIVHTSKVNFRCQRLTFKKKILLFKIIHLGDTLYIPM